MHYLVYSSTANIPLDENELHRLLQHWRATNTRLGITGVLLYSAGHIMQLLEGEPEPVHTLFAAIAADLRHRGVTKLADGPVERRAFADWSMRFRAVDIADFTRFVQQTKSAPDHASSLVPLLEAFAAQEPWN